MSIESIKKLIIFLFFFIIFTYTFSPSYSETDIITDSQKNWLSSSKIKKFMILTVTGYSSSYDETDNDPFITAYNTLVRDGIAASNILPFGTKIKIPQLFGDKIFIIEDKMNPRFNENLDIWFKTKEEALKFGIHYNVLVEILE
jgi:3D (Asp-Asp-Asp) domain-containing protein